MSSHDATRDSANENRSQAAQRQAKTLRCEFTTMDPRVPYRTKSRISSWKRESKLTLTQLRRSSHEREHVVLTVKAQATNKRAARSTIMCLSGDGCGMRASLYQNSPRHDGSDNPRSHHRAPIGRFLKVKQASKRIGKVWIET